MRWRMVGGVLVGSMVVAAACSATNGGGPQTSGDEGALDAMVDSIADALGLDHIESDALASEKPSVVTLKCDGSLGTTAKSWSADQAYPGRTAADLARGSALLCEAGGVDGFDCVQVAMRVKDGAVRIVCGPQTSPQPSVTIVMPTPL